MLKGGGVIRNRGSPREAFAWNIRTDGSVDWECLFRSGPAGVGRTNWAV